MGHTMAQVEKTIFISYRRANEAWALATFQHLKREGYDVFMDTQTNGSGAFEKTIIENIKHRAHFLVILTPSALDKCNESGDWLRREIETAIETRRNIVPIMMEGFDFDDPRLQEFLTGNLSLLKRYNGLPIYSMYFEAGMQKLINEFLNVDLKDVPHPEPLSKEVKKATQQQIKEISRQEPVKQNQLTAQIWFDRGYQASQKGDYTEAIRFYEKSIELDPEFVDTHNNLGYVLNNMERYEEAKQFLQKAVELDPAYAYAYHNLGNSLKNLGQYQEAEQAYRKAILLDPEDAYPYNGLGNTLKELKQYQEAEQAYRKAIQLDPQYVNAYNHLGILLAELKQYQEAERVFRKAIQLDPQYVNAYNNLGILLYQTNRYEEAQQALFKAIEIDPTYSSAYYNMACLRSLQKRMEDGFDWLQKAFDNNFDGPTDPWQDPDLENLRTADLARFTAIVGPNPNPSESRTGGINSPVLPSSLTSV